MENRPMRRDVRMIRAVPAMLVVLALAGCSSGNFDPTDVFNVLNTKKPLPGERKAVFPQGVPGVTQGVPSELVKGNQPPPGTDAPMGLAANAQDGASQAAAQPAAEPAARPEPAEKPRAQRRVTAKTSPAPARPAGQDPPEAAVWPEPPRPSAQRPAKPAADSPWPDPARQPAQQAGQAASSPWPDSKPAQPAGTSSPSPWPDPPASGTFSR
jgi:hypothetical protein